MIKIWKITLDSTKENLWEKRISTCSESKYNGSEDRDLKVYWKRYHPKEYLFLCKT